MIEYAVPILPSRDLNETLAFYLRLGFENRGAPPEVWDYLIIGRGGIELHFYSDPEVDPLTTSASCYVRTADAAALHREWDDVGVPTDPVTGSHIGKLRHWNDDRGNLTLVFDAAGRVVENVMMDRRDPGPPWWLTVLDTAASWWPF